MEIKTPEQSVLPKQPIKVEDKVKEVLTEIVPLKSVVYRKAQGRYQSDFPAFFESLKVMQLVYMTQSESDGNVTTTIIYR